MKIERNTKCPYKAKARSIETKAYIEGVRVRAIEARVIESRYQSLYIAKC